MRTVCKDFATHSRGAFEVLKTSFVKTGAQMKYESCLSYTVIQVSEKLAGRRSTITPHGQLSYKDFLHKDPLRQILWGISAKANAQRFHPLQIRSSPESQQQNPRKAAVAESDPPSLRMRASSLSSTPSRASGFSASSCAPKAVEASKVLTETRVEPCKVFIDRDRTCMLVPCCCIIQDFERMS